MIVIDSFKALHAFAREPSDFRWFLHDFAARLSASGASSFWVGEYGPDDIAREPEFAVADAIIQLSSIMVNERESRVLQVLKLRGSGFLSGRHAYRLSEKGIDVFPRLADIGDATGYELSDERISSGIPALDTMLGDGYWPGACTLVAGPSGSGKTVMGLSFIFGGAARGERGLIANLQENPSQLQRTASGFGWSLVNPNVSLLYRSTVDLYIDEWVYAVLEALESQNVTRLVIDSLGDLAFASPDQVRLREYIYSLTQRCSRRGISVLMTMEVPDLFHLSRLSESGISNMSDNVILLQFLRSRSRVKRALTVLKTRASLHEPEIREYKITDRGHRRRRHLRRRHRGAPDGLGPADAGSDLQIRRGRGGRGRRGRPGAGARRSRSPPPRRSRPPRPPSCRRTTAAPPPAARRRTARGRGWPR